jgi:hypothetical protein
VWLANYTTKEFVTWLVSEDEKIEENDKVVILASSSLALWK